MQCFQFEQYSSCYVRGPQPVMNCSSLVPDCRQLWFVHIKCIQWTHTAVGRRDTPPAPVCHCCFWCHHGTAKPFLLSDREALRLRQKKMFNTRVFPALMTKLELKKHNSAYCVGIDLPPLSSLAFCISIFTSVPSMAPRCQLQFPVFGSDYW